MDRHVAIMGGSVAGLATGVGLARRGWRVTIIERDVAPQTDDGDEAFLLWDRRNVPQFRQPHAFSARSRNLLLEYIPEVVERMRADGIEEINLFKMLAPPEYWSDEDDAYTGLWSRRPAFELALRRTAEIEPGVEIVAPATVVGITTSDGTNPLHVTGLRLEDGRDVEADLVIDAAGRRSPVPKWLAAHGIEVPFVVQDTESVYYARYYRLNPASGLSPFGILALQAQLERMSLIGFPGDHNTYGLAAFVREDDDDVKLIRHNWAWDALMGSVPGFATWSDPANGSPLTDVQFMGGHQNIRRHYVVDGNPAVAGMLSVGDSLCTTNPMYGWGASMTLTYAFAAVEAATEHADDHIAMARAYDAAVREEADGVYHECAAMDRLRNYYWRGEEIPESFRAEADRQELIRCIAAGALRDPVLGRAQLRRTNLLENPRAALDDPIVVERAQNTQRILAAKADRPFSPTRAELVAAIHAAADRA